eukprot:TRINITY_DN891_c0_g1_i6.p1 TRINITY_DN891_c0_g1~~TRINITY_DN891_c0_g1_i6.p1  ORF type:complete len:320 (-),score=70.90 TRINITY_DN891_c0_g1_i6:70-1029(-)
MSNFQADRLRIWKYDFSPSKKLPSEKHESKTPKYKENKRLNRVSTLTDKKKEQLDNHKALLNNEEGRKRKKLYKRVKDQCVEDYSRKWRDTLIKYLKISGKKFEFVNHNYIDVQYISRDGSTWDWSRHHGSQMYRRRLIPVLTKNNEDVWCINLCHHEIVVVEAGCIESEEKVDLVLSVKRRVEYVETAYFPENIGVEDMKKILPDTVDSTELEYYYHVHWGSDITCQQIFKDEAELMIQTLKSKGKSYFDLNKDETDDDDDDVEENNEGNDESGDDDEEENDEDEDSGDSVESDEEKEEEENQVEELPKDESTNYSKQ